MGTCTIIAAPCQDWDGNSPYFAQFVPIKEAIETADMLHAANHGKYVYIRVYAETNGGATLTLIYQPI
jgi:hypothetical protein